MSPENKKFVKEAEKEISFLNETIQHHIKNKTPLIMSFGPDVGKFFVAIGDTKKSIFLNERGNRNTIIDVFDFLRFLNCFFDDGVEFFFAPNIKEQFRNVGGSIYTYQDTDSGFLYNKSENSGFLIWKNGLFFIPQRNLCFDEIKKIKDFISKDLKSKGFIGSFRLKILEKNCSKSFSYYTQSINFSNIEEILLNNISTDAQLSPFRKKIIKDSISIINSYGQ